MGVCKVYVENYDNDEERDGSGSAGGGMADLNAATECVLVDWDVGVAGVLCWGFSGYIE